MVLPMAEIHVIEDRDVWNAFVTALPIADLRQSYEWGEIPSAEDAAARLAAARAGPPYDWPRSIEARASPGSPS